MKYCWLSFLVFCLLPYEVGAASKHKRVRPHPQGIAYFIPFPVETYVPVTPETINKDGDKAILTPDDVFILARILQDRGKSAEFESVKTRLRIERSNAMPVFVDQNGNVVEGSQRYSLRPVALVSLAELMEKRFQGKLTSSDK